jgi:uncharacterized protein
MPRLIQILLLTGLCLGLPDAGFQPCQAEEARLEATNILQGLVNDRPLHLSLTQGASQPFAFEFRAAQKAVAGQAPAFRPTVFRVRADRDDTSIVIQSDDGLPYCFMKRGLFVCCDPVNDGGLAYYEGGTIDWEFASGAEDNINFNCSFVAANEPARIVVDLKQLLQRALSKGTNFSCDQKSRTVQVISDKGSVLHVAPAGEDMAPRFGIRELDLSSENTTVALSNFQVVTLTRDRTDLARRDLEKTGLPLRVLNSQELLRLSLFVPVEFPKNEKEKRAAEKLKDALGVRPPDFEETSSRARKGDVTAQANLGVMYFKGDGVTQNYTEAAVWLRKAAEQGDVQSQYNLGILYDTGKGLPQNSGEALKWYRKAAENGYPQAAVNIGTMYLRGKGVARNTAEAIQWFRQAGDHGLPLGYNYVGLMYLQGDGVSANTNEAVAWYRKAAEKGSAWAQTELGVRYGRGDGLERDETKAVEWYRKAAEQGYAPAQADLGAACLNGWGVATNVDEAVQWFRRSAAQGNPVAERNLGICFIIGLGVVKEPAEAYKWLSLAVKQNDAQARVALDRFSREISPEDVAEGLRRARTFAPQPAAAPDEPR